MRNGLPDFLLPPARLILQLYCVRQVEVPRTAARTTTRHVPSVATEENTRTVHEERVNVETRTTTRRRHQRCREEREKNETAVQTVRVVIQVTLVRARAARAECPF